MLLVDTMQSPCGQGAYTLAEKERLIVKIQQAAAHNIVCLSTWVFFKRTSRQKKNKKEGWKTGEATTYDVPLYLVYLSHEGRFGQPRTNWRRGRLQKAAKTKDRCVVHMCASSVLSRRATSPAPAQRQNCSCFST